MSYIDHIKDLLLNEKERLQTSNKFKACNALVEILEDEINNFSYENESDITYLFSLFDELANLIGDNQNIRKNLYERFIFIHNNIRTILHSNKPQNSKERSKYKLLCNVLNKMENTLLRIYIENPVDYDPNKEEFIDHIIFKLKYYNFVENSLTRFPYLSNSIDKNDIPLIERVLDGYLSSLHTYLSKPNLGPLDDLIYFDKVFSFLVKSTNKYNKKLLIEKIKDFAKNEECITSRHKEKLSFYTNNAIDVILGIENEEDISYLNYKYEIHDNFKEAHKLEAKNIILRNKDIGPISTDRKIYTFDCEGAKELDDGLSITYEDGIYHLGVHIADPGSYIDDNSILMDEAKRRTTSIYMDDDCIPLYLLELSGDLMSLNTGKKTHCMSYYFDIDARNGNLINFDIKNEICEIAGNLSYSSFDECLKNGTGSDELAEIVYHLSNISPILKRVYNENELYEQFHGNQDKSIGSSIVESAMIYTNHHVAKKFDEFDLPFLYRCHHIEEEDIIKLDRLQSLLKENDENKIANNIDMIKRLMPVAYYSRKNVGHFGLGTKYYSHSTSPLRRLADNLVNECIKKFILNPYTKDDVKKMEDKLDETAEIINNKRRSIDDYQIQYQKVLAKKNNIV